MEMRITLKNEVKEKLIKESLFTVQTKHVEAKQEQYMFESVLSNDISRKNRESIANQCVKIADDAHFPTDYNDVYAHLFNGNFELAFLRRNGELKGFAVFDLLNVNDKKILYLHGVIISRKAQCHGNTRELLKRKIKETNADIFALRTHNPRMYSVAASLTSDKNKVFPNFQSEIPNEVLELSKKINFIKNVNEQLVVRGAYLDEKIQQKVSDDNILSGFKENVGTLDAQAVIVYLDKSEVK